MAANPTQSKDKAFPASAGANGFPIRWVTAEGKLLATARCLALGRGAGDLFFVFVVAP
jgi:hypothetical protein